MTTIPVNDPRWRYMNPPTTTSAASGDGKMFVLVTNRETDWWRTPTIDSNNGIVYGFEQEIGEEGIEISVDVLIHYKVQVGCLLPCDQATLFLHLSPTTWVKAGTEFDQGKLWNSAVVCNPYSDWSLQPHTPNSSTRFTISLKGQTLRIYLGEEMIREVMAFGPESAQGKKAFIGIMACSPKGGMAEAFFTSFELKEGVRGG